jgi:SAM-dependent methyltransferase
VRVLEEVVELLSCPDDGQRLRLERSTLCCQDCDRRFSIDDGNYVELLPKSPTDLGPSVEPEYRNQYLDLFGRKFRRSDESGTAWGAMESVPPAWIRKRQRQVRIVQDLLVGSGSPENMTVCDFAAGAGHYTIAYASLFKLVLHCDLSPENLNYSRNKARDIGLNNVFFLRIDYFRPPFRHSLDRVICMDTIIRGYAHDQLLLKGIFAALNWGGEAIIDFHNWWHNPFRRLGLLKDNFSFNKSYSRKEAESLLESIGISRYKYTPFFQEFEPQGLFGPIWSRLMPPTRVIYSIGGYSRRPSENRQLARWRP